MAKTYHMHLQVTGTPAYVRKHMAAMLADQLVAILDFQSGKEPHDFLECDSSSWDETTKRGWDVVVEDAY